MHKIQIELCTLMSKYIDRLNWTRPNMFLIGANHTKHALNLAIFAYKAFKMRSKKYIKVLSSNRKPNNSILIRQEYCIVFYKISLSSICLSAYLLFVYSFL